MNLLENRTAAFQAFLFSMEPAYTLARIIMTGGLQHLSEEMNQANAVSQEASGMEVMKFLSLSEEERSRIQIAPDSVTEMEIVFENASKISMVAHTTVPSVLLIYLMSVLEFYIEDVLYLIYQTQPHLLVPTEISLGRKSKNTRDLKDRVHNLVYRCRFDQIGERIFQQNLKIPITDICSKAGTNLTNFDIAKAIRNIYIHNQGRVDKQFIDRTKIKDVAINEYYPISIDYINELNQHTNLLVCGIDLTASTLYPRILSK